MADRTHRYIVGVPLDVWRWTAPPGHELRDDQCELLGWLAVRTNPRPESDREQPLWWFDADNATKVTATNDPELAVVLTTLAEFGWAKAWEAAQLFIDPDSLTAMRLGQKEEA